MRVAVMSVHTCPLASLGGWETGGMNVYVRELGRALGAAGVEVDIFTRRQACDSPDVVEYAPNARVVHLDAGPHRQLDKYDVLDYLPEFACGVQRWRALTGVQYDLIHNHYWLSGKIGLLFRELWDVPMVTMFHTLGQLKNRVAESAAETEQTVRADIERRTMAASDRVIAATDVDRAQMLRFYGSLSDVAVIPGGVDLAHFTPRSRSAARAQLGLGAVPVLLFVGRIQRLKGIDVLLKAFDLLRREGGSPDARLLIVGGLPDAGTHRAAHEAREIARLQRLANRLGIEEAVSFVGAVQQDQLPLYYAAADVTVMPSSYESFGLVAVESLACGTPVVATRVGGLATIVRDGRTGFLVPWRDPALFAQRLSELLRDGGLRATMQAEARPSVLRFGWDRIAQQHLALYHDVIGERMARVSGAESLG